MPLACGNPKTIWGTKTPLKINVFLWLLAHERLLTKCRVSCALWQEVGMATSLAPFSLAEMWEAGAALCARAGQGWAKAVARLIIPVGA
ncbi:hypothetical protein QJS10_CPA16g00383 [Acorus calamus]|uniref:Reverse transcriptase zinc-binding domain-containing protein n=1 Tax=Acorus calamus TaxID=4465 RepID=A0AAV9D0F1_ACOCL|nr:hypothetical protein QJS10_CPA16g00383 [Acorus calamus]